MSAFTPANLNLISPIPPQKTKNSSRFAFETAAVIILLYRISDVILDYVIETGVNVVALAPDGRAPFAGYCVEIVVLYVCALEARLAADDIPVGGVCSVAAALYDQIVQLKFELLNSVST